MVAGESQREALLIALTTLLGADATLTALIPGGIHRVRAPQGDDAPGPLEAFLVVRTRPGGRIVQTLGRARALRYVNVEIVGVVPGAGTITAERIDERVEHLVADATLTLASPWTASKPRRLVDIDDSTVVDGRETDQLGGLYRVALSGWSS